MRLFAFFPALISVATLAFGAIASVGAAAARALEPLIAVAFPMAEPPPEAVAVAAAPRVLGLDESRAFGGRILSRQAGRRRAPLSTAFVTA